MLLKHRCDLFAIGPCGPTDRPQLFVEGLPAPGCIHHDDLPGLIGQVQEGVWHFRGEIGKSAFVEVVDRVADADLEAAFGTVAVPASRRSDAVAKANYFGSASVGSIGSGT